jgi:prepilin-type N-terminal cleavage/methylation domain-containing protein
MMRLNRLQGFQTASERGFSFLELMVAVAIMLIVSAVILQGLGKMSKTNSSIDNRTQMHAAVRSATELLQQEIGQAGKIALPTDRVTLTGSVTVPVDSTVSAMFTVSPNALGMFQGEELVVDSGANEETVALTNVDLGSNQIIATFTKSHGSGIKAWVAGGFANGIIPTVYPNGSTGSVLKMFGDINDDGKMMYVEYKCDTTAGKLYRNAMSVSATGKLDFTDDLVLLPNITVNPPSGATPCFTYQESPVPLPIPSGSCQTSNPERCYVLNVAVTLTVQTENEDPVTHQREEETKALLNVSPRNVYETWLLANSDFKKRIQPVPANVNCLISATPGATNACLGY